MEFSYKPVNPFQDDGLSKEDRALINGMRTTAYICGYSGGDVEFKVEQALKHMGRYDLLPPCERNSAENGEKNIAERLEELKAYKEKEGEEKTGHWIKMPIGFKCFNCNELEDKTTKCCPNCGAIMIEPQESEVEE